MVLTSTDPQLHPAKDTRGPSPRRPRSFSASPGRVLPAILFTTIGLLIVIDLLTDVEAGTDLAHAAAEGLVLALATLGGALLWIRAAQNRRLAKGLGRDLQRAQAEAEKWRAEAASSLAGLGAAIDSQFERWQLTNAEREVGLLILKGLSLREIAEVRSTRERTVRQQALVIYRKAGISGRAELSAFFLEDLLLPRSGP